MARSTEPEFMAPDERCAALEERVAKLEETVRELREQLLEHKHVGEHVWTGD